MAPSSHYGGWGPLPAFQTPFTADRPKRPPHLACNMSSSYRDQLHPQAASLETQNCGTGVARCYSYSYSNQATVEAQRRFITINKGMVPQHCRLSKQLQTKPSNNWFGRRLEEVAWFAHSSLINNTCSRAASADDVDSAAWALCTRGSGFDATNREPSYTLLLFGPHDPAPCLVPSFGCLSYDLVLPCNRISLCYRIS